MSYLRVATVKWAKPIDSDELQQVYAKVENELPSYLKSLPGFLSYRAATIVSDTGVGIFEWESEEHALKGRDRIMEWLNQKGITSHIVSIDAHGGPVTLSV